MSSVAGPALALAIVLLRRSFHFQRRSHREKVIAVLVAHIDGDKLHPAFGQPVTPDFRGGFRRFALSSVNVGQGQAVFVFDERPVFAQIKSSAA